MSNLQQIVKLLNNIADKTESNFEFVVETASKLGLFKV